MSGCLIALVPMILNSLAGATGFIYPNEYELH